MSAANKELSRRFTELFSTGDETLARDVLSQDVVFHGTNGDGEIRGIDAMLRFVSGYRHAFPDARSTVEDQVAEGDKVVTRWRAAGTHRGARPERWGYRPRYRLSLRRSEQATARPTSQGFACVRERGDGRCCMRLGWPRPDWTESP
jgi:hypothetical protein